MPYKGTSKKDAFYFSCAFKPYPKFRVLAPRERKKSSNFEKGVSVNEKIACKYLA